MLAIHAGSWWEVRQQLRAGYQDFTTFYTAGRMVSEGEGHRLYDNASQAAIQQKLAPHVTIRKGLLPYIHPPIEAAILVPFARLPYFQAYLLWDLLNLAALAGALLILRPHLAAFHSQPLAFWLLVALAFFPVSTALLQGQDVLLLLLVFSLAYSAMRKHASFSAGCWLGLGLLRFPLVLPFMLILARRKPWRLISGFFLVGALLGVASAAAVGWKQTALYPAYLLRVDRTLIGPITSPNMPNVRGLVENAMSCAGVSTYAAGIIVFVSLALLWFCASHWNLNADGARFDLGFSLAILGAVLASYNAYLHDLSVLLIPILLIADYCHARPGKWRNWSIVAPIFVLFLTPLYVVVFLRMQLGCLWSVVLLAWFWGIAREVSGISKEPGPPAGDLP